MQYVNVLQLQDAASSVSCWRYSWGTKHVVRPMQFVGALCVLAEGAIEVS